MREPHVVKDYLQDMLEALDKAVQFVGDYDLSEFEQDEQCGYAVIRCLEIVGEAAKKIPAGVRQKQGAIPWKNLAGMRDKLIHDYAGVDLKVVFETVKRDIPYVREMLQSFIKELEE